MKIALAQQNYTIGDFKSNKEKIVRCIEQAKSESADLVVFSEQAISGAPAYDLLNKVTFLELCEETLEEIARCCEGISVLVGMPAQCMNDQRGGFDRGSENQAVRREKDDRITRRNVPYIVVERLRVH